MYMCTYTYILCIYNEHMLYVGRKGEREREGQRERERGRLLANSCNFIPPSSVCPSVPVSVPKGLIVES